MKNWKWIIDNYFYDGSIPHRGLDPRSAANINTELQRHRDYNKKKNSVTLCLCVEMITATCNSDYLQ